MPPLPPGRLGLPWLGETISFGRDPFSFFLDHVRRYGPVWKTRVLGENVICLVGPEGFAFFHDPANAVRSGATPRNVVEMLGPTSSHFLDGAAHLRRKRLTLQSFSPAALAEYAPSIEAITRRHLGRWMIAGELGGVEAFHRLALSIAAHLILGTPVTDDAADLFTPARAATRMLDSLPIDLPFTPYRRARDARRVVADRVARAADTFQPTGENRFLARLVAARDGAELLSPDEIKVEATDNFLTIFSGMGSALSLAALTLATHPSVMDRARTELVAGQPAYLDRALHEVRRYIPFLPIPVFGRLTADHTFRGYLLPKGWLITAGIHATHRDPTLFHDADNFDPDRFLPGGEAKLNTYVAHAGGSPDEHSHHCSGEPLADALLNTVIGTLLRGHTWDLPPQDLSLDPRTVPFPLPRGGLRLRFRTI